MVIAMLMILAFLVDQPRQLCCPLLQAAWAKLGSNRALWDNQRFHFRQFAPESTRHLPEELSGPKSCPPPRSTVPDAPRHAG